MHYNIPLFEHINNLTASHYAPVVLLSPGSWVEVGLVKHHVFVINYFQKRCGEINNSIIAVVKNICCGNAGKVKFFLPYCCGCLLLLILLVPLCHKCIEVVRNLYDFSSISKHFFNKLRGYSIAVVQFNKFIVSQFYVLFKYVLPN